MPWRLDCSSGKGHALFTLGTRRDSEICDIVSTNYGVLVSKGLYADLERRHT